MDDAFYREELLDHFDSSPHRGTLDGADLGAELDNPLCGDRVCFELAMDPDLPDRIACARFHGHGCVISQAAASILAERVEGKPIGEARSLTPDEMIGWLGIPLTPARRKCGLLALKTMHRAIDVGPRAEAPAAS
ncbi:iron-sulfur cluster assembly scaffold protein [Tautonia plasticadhaerens]|uniref:NifU-like protein n=1 Tax=Tautonia plasticadhaerens TaxID=2527974 RepID=A0A518GXI1_9BACT|nr:iron-sulfur cluster assembly scaffold protein [Tautonia plasticadhaerens]QDV33291.1 NifU-like protein [Tautonia plasticadhaerens]